jgi:hypothetical protein
MVVPLKTPEGIVSGIEPTKLLANTVPPDLIAPLTSNLYPDVGVKCPMLSDPSFLTANMGPWFILIILSANWLSDVEEVTIRNRASEYGVDVPMLKVPLLYPKAPLPTPGD